MLARGRGFTAVALLTLALGIGVNTAIFSVVNAVLLKPLPYPDSARLVMIWATGPSGTLWAASGPDFVDWKQQNQVFDGMAGFTPTGAALTAKSGALHLQGFEVSPEVFQLLGVKPFIGRNFSTDETRPGQDSVILLSYSLWQRAFGGDRSAVGSKVILNDGTYLIAGVMPRDLTFPDVWGHQPEF
jgi:putative ABC transport system permease protein